MMKTSKRIFEDIVQVIKTDIASGKFKPYQKLGSERSLSQKFKVGRGSIREAIKTLEALGIVTLRNGRGGGIFVSADANCQTANALSLLLRLAKSNLLDSLEFRKMFEPRMAFYAAVRRTKEDLRNLIKPINAMEKNINTPDNFSKANRDFHLTIAKASNNAFLFTFYQNTLPMLEDWDRLLGDIPGQLDLTIYFHTQIYKAILEKDPQKSEMLMNAHLSQIENDIRIAKAIAIGDRKGR
jgi:GntR family transcriptional repressor for pyruvate dehydrogenase complex